MQELAVCMVNKLFKYRYHWVEKYHTCLSPPTFPVSVPVENERWPVYSMVIVAEIVGVSGCGGVTRRILSYME
jgi:hypothetical protein